MDNARYFRSTKMENINFPIQIFSRTHAEAGQILGFHWHEHIQLYWITDGKGILHCNSKTTPVTKGDVVIINSNELHYLESSGMLGFYVITIDFAFLFSHQVDVCHTKYLVPICQNLILFDNYIGSDTEVTDCLKRIISEFEAKYIGYELEIKACTYHLIVLLLRSYVKKTITPKEHDLLQNNLKRFHSIFAYINANYHQNIALSQLSKMINVSDSHFCRLFRRVSGKSLNDYINDLRLNEAMKLLKESDLNITEIALLVGFSDSNYFSRIFKKHKKISPSQIRISI